MKRVTILSATAAVALSLAGCAAQRQEEARVAVSKAVEECRAPYPPNTHFLDRANCEAPTRRWAAQKTGVAPDMVDLFLAKRAMISSRVDSGQITREQGNVEIASMNVEINQMIAQRNQANAMAMAAILAAMPQPQVYQAPQPYAMPVRAPVTTNCMRMGLSVNCTSY